MEDSPSFEEVSSRLGEICSELIRHKIAEFASRLDKLNMLVMELETKHERLQDEVYRIIRES